MYQPDLSNLLSFRGLKQTVPNEKWSAPALVYVAMSACVDMPPPAMTTADGKSVFMVVMMRVVYDWSIAPARAPLCVGSVLDA